MSVEDESEPLRNNFYLDSKSPSEGLSPDMFEDHTIEVRDREKNRISTFEMVPAVSVPEKIVFYIDTSQDMGLGYMNNLSDKNTTEAPLIMKEALKVFFVNKLAIAKDTKFALVSIQPGEVQLMSHFTSNVKDLVRSLSEVTGLTKPNEKCMSDYDVTPIFSQVLSSIELPENLSKKVPPEFLLRVIFIYNNSHCIPRLNEVDKFYTKFINSPYCIFDVVHLHEAQSDFNGVINIYEQFSKIISPRSYLLECSRNVTLVYNTFAKLIAHPYQRVSQSLWKF